MSESINKLVDQLCGMYSCSEAVDWVRGQTSAPAAWQNCERGDWMLWLAGKLSGKKGGKKRKRLVLCACECARLALPYVPQNEKRPLAAIETAEAWARDEGPTLNNVRAAADDVYDARAAYTAAYTAYTDDAAAAVYACASAAAAVCAYANAAAYTDDAHADAYDAARTKTLAACAGIVRKHYPKNADEKEGNKLMSESTEKLSEKEALLDTISLWNWMGRNNCSSHKQKIMWENLKGKHYVNRCACCQYVTDLGYGVDIEINSEGCNHCPLHSLWGNDCCSKDSPFEKFLHANGTPEDAFKISDAASKALSKIFALEKKEKKNSDTKAWEPKIGDVIRHKETGELRRVTSTATAYDVIIRLIGAKLHSFSPDFSDYEAAPDCQIEIVESKDKTLKVWLEYEPDKGTTIRVITGLKKWRNKGALLAGWGGFVCGGDVVWYTYHGNWITPIVEAIRAAELPKPELHVGGMADCNRDKVKILLGPSGNNEWLIELNDGCWFAVDAGALTALEDEK